MKKFISIAHANSASLVPRKPSVRRRTAPTLLTSTSRRPCSSTARATRRGPVRGGEIDRDRRDAVQTVEAVGGARSGDDERALVGQRLHDGQADALAGPGDDGDLAGELEVHRMTVHGRP